MINDILEKFNENQNFIYKLNDWKLLYRENQVTFGSMVIIYCGDDCDSLSKVSKKSFSDLPEFINIIEKIMRDTYDANKFNYMALMMIDSQPHFHVFPRFAKSVNFCNKKYNDNFYPKPVVIEDNFKLNTATKTKFINDFRKQIDRILNAH